MTLEEICKVVIRGEAAIKFPLKYDDFGQTIFDDNGDMVFQIRGWGRLQYWDAGREKAAELQDSIGQWVVDTLNEEYRRTITKTI